MINNIFKSLIIALLTGILLISYFTYKTYERNSRFYIDDTGGVLDKKIGKKYFLVGEKWNCIDKNNEWKATNNPFDNN